MSKNYKKRKDEKPLKNEKGAIIKKDKKYKKMTPYSRNGEAKWMLNDSTEIQRSVKKRSKKEEVRNANRSLKKGMRQNLKRDLDEQIKEFFDKN
jgi:hypothetical protein